MNVATPESVMSALYSVPAELDCDRNAMQANTFVNNSAAHGTPRLSVLPKNFGAMPLRAIWVIVRLATYNDELPAESTEMTMSALMRCAAGAMFASDKAMVSGDAAVFEPFPSRRGSFAGIRIPMKNIIPT